MFGWFYLVFYLVLFDLMVVGMKVKCMRFFWNFVGVDGKLKLKFCWFWDWVYCLIEVVVMVCVVLIFRERECEWCFLWSVGCGGI